MMNILFIADIVGEEVLDVITDLLPRLKNYYKLDFVVANVENADKGKGITTRQADKLKKVGVDCLTSGNHIWEPRKKDVLIDHAGYLLRPINYPQGNIGVGSAVITLPNRIKIAVLNLQGRSFMYPIECPFAAAEAEIRKLRHDSNIILVDFHAEATAEKQALGWALDGKVTAVIGTHTHVQTADERILPKGTGYITDAGMCGPFDSVIGMDKHKAIDRFKLQTHIYYAIAKNDLRMNAILLNVDEQSGKTKKIIRLNFNAEEFKKDYANY